MDAYGDAEMIIFFGGGSKSRLWSQIVSDATGLEILVPETVEAASAGAAMLAGKAAGMFRDGVFPVPECRERFVPGPGKKLLDEKYAEYRNIEKKLWSEKA